MRNATGRQIDESNAPAVDNARLNPHWLAFFREVRRLAALAREREAAQASARTVSNDSVADTINPKTQKASVGAEADADSQKKRNHITSEKYTLDSAEIAD
jgi:hypothetical protein